MPYRGNVYRQVSQGRTQCFQYESTGVVTAWIDGLGHYTNSAPSAGTCYSPLR